MNWSICQTCGAKFITATEYRRHMWDVHNVCLTRKECNYALSDKFKDNVIKR